MAEGRYLIGIDVGTTAVKGGLFGLNGAVIACHRVAYPIHRPKPQYVEQNPADWIAAIETILSFLLKDISPSDVMAVGLCSQGNTQVFIDRDGVPLMPAIVWQDGRTAAVAAELDERGGGLGIGATSAIGRMEWVARYHPGIWEKTAYVLSPKDYCLFKMTGVLAADPIGAFDAVDSSGHYIPQLLALVPGAAEKLPPLHNFDAILGKMRFPAFPELNALVVNGTMDGWACLPGAGVSGIGEGAYISGTSEIISLVSDRSLGAPGIVSFMPAGGWCVHAGPTQSGGDSLRWFSQACGQPIDYILDHAAKPDRSRSQVLFLPHLEGERAPIWDPHSRGAFIGLESDTRFDQLAAAVLEGVAFSARLLFQAASAAAGARYDSLFIGGGGAKSDIWCQIRADILGVELRRNEFLDSGTLGAAVIAGVGVGLFPSLSQAARTMARTGRNFTPNGALHRRYDDLFQLYQDTYRALKPIYRDLGSIGRKIG
jgi:xylulokinase